VEGELRILFIAAALSVAAPAFAQAATPAQLERETWDAFKAKNVSEIRSLFAPGFVGVYADGTHDLARELQGLQRATIEDYRLANLESRAVDRDDVLLTYEADFNARVAGKTISQRRWMASLWHRTHGRWVCVYHTEINAKP
jgi:hypothetical protein